LVSGPGLVIATSCGAGVLEAGEVPVAEELVSEGSLVAEPGVGEPDAEELAGEELAVAAAPAVRSPGPGWAVPQPAAAASVTTINAAIGRDKILRMALPPLRAMLATPRVLGSGHDPER
jgi:hypothetical protein